MSELPKVFQAEKRVRFRGFVENGFAIEVLSWVTTRDFDEFTRVTEELNMSIAQIV